jgi:DNA-nicking Smr family endonuclease
MDNSEDPEPVPLPIDGVLDLHAFSPRHVDELVGDYLRACLAQGLTDIRIIHGKGKGILRERVHACLRKSDMVLSFRLAGDGAGGWGATLVRLRAGREGK